ncbi:hypothetical protein JM82_1989 [Olleya sp. Hel_I_94]|jgi:hypothetical protein|nr:hypothetical protein JM82_1989 [Olleya sp. Hel_I_94]
MKKESFWDSVANYIKFKTIIPLIVLAVLLIVLLIKSLYNTIIG